MSEKSAGPGGNAAAGAAAALLLVVVLVGAYSVFSPGTPQMPLADAPARDAPKVVQAGTPAAAPSDPVEEIAAPAPETTAPRVPTFDELRREPDGATLIAGRAEPLSDVRILVDGDEIATAKADSSGGFAAFATLPAKPEPQVLTLNAGVDGSATESDDQIILAPATVVAPVLGPDSDVATAAAEPGAPDATRPVTKAGIPDQPTTSAGRTTATPTADTEAQESPTTARAPDMIAPAPTPEVAILKSDAAGVALIQPARPEALSAVALDTIGYSAVGDVQLSGRAQASAQQVRIYLDNRAILSLPVGSDGRWRAELPDVDEGVYTLRVDELGATGEVSSRVETPFKRESEEILAQASANVDGPISAVTVQKGATLWAIARDRYGDGLLYVRVFEANADSIRDPDLIYPGQVFELPE